MSFLEGFFGFFVESSYVERQKAKYAEVIKEINKELEKTIYLEYQMEQLRIDFEVMKKSPESVEGKIRTTFEEKEEGHCQEFEILYGNLMDTISDINNMLSTLQTEYEYWCAEVEKEKQLASKGCSE